MSAKRVTLRDPVTNKQLYPATLADQVFNDDGTKFKDTVEQSIANVRTAIIGEYPIVPNMSVVAGEVVDIVNGKVSKSYLPSEMTMQSNDISVSGSGWIASIKIDDNHIAYFYRNNTSISYAIATLTGDNVTFSAISLLASGLDSVTTQNRHNILVKPLVDNRYILTTFASNNGYINAYVITRDELTFTIGQPYQFYGGYSGTSSGHGPDHALETISDTQFVTLSMYFGKGNKVRLFNVNGTTISLVTELSISSSVGGIRCDNFDSIKIHDDNDGGKRVTFVSTDVNDTYQNYIFTVKILNDVLTIGTTTARIGSSQVPYQKLLFDESSNNIYVFWSLGESDNTRKYYRANITVNGVQTTVSGNTVFVSHASENMGIMNACIFNQYIIITTFKYMFVLDRTTLSLLVEGTISNLNDKYFLDLVVLNGKFIAVSSNSYYSVVYIIDNKLSGTPIPLATQAIALQAGSAEENIKVVFDGIIQTTLPNGTLIYSDGVRGKVIEGMLSVIPEWYNKS